MDKTPSQIAYETYCGGEWECQWPAGGSKLWDKVAAAVIAHVRPQIEAEAKLDKILTHVLEDARMSDSNNCEICGCSVLYGSRHAKCGRSVMAIEKERDELRALAALSQQEAGTSQHKESAEAVAMYKKDRSLSYAYFYENTDKTGTILFDNDGSELNGIKPHRVEKIWLDSQLDRALTHVLEDASSQRDKLRVENEKLRNALQVAQFQIKAND